METQWDTGDIDPRAVAERRPAGDEVAHTGWRYWHQGDAWCNGAEAITAEVIAAWPQERVQSYAVRMTGDLLPPEAFPPPPPPVVQVVEAVRSLGWIAP